MQRKRKLDLRIVVNLPAGKGRLHLVGISNWLPVAESEIFEFSQLQVAIRLLLFLHLDT